MPANNHCHFIGNFVRDPQGKDVVDGDGNSTRVVRFTIGCNNRRYKNKKVAAFPNCEVWGKGAELIEQYCTKGDQIAVECEMISESWPDKTTGETRYGDKFRVIDFTFTGKKGDQGQGRGDASQPEAEAEDDADVDPEPKPAPRRGRGSANENATGGRRDRKPVGAGASRGRSRVEPPADDEDDDNIPF